MDHFMPVGVHDIESEFDRIWQESSSAGGDGSSVRLRISNFLAWGVAARAAEDFERVMEVFAERHPCRGILAMLSAEAEAVQASISAHCWRTAAGGRHICSEEIVLVAPEGSRRALASAVLALLVPDLPVHLWLIDDTASVMQVPDEILNTADRLYLDTAKNPRAAEAIASALEVKQALDVRVIDFAWLRAAEWRELAAQLFDGPSRSLLGKVTSIEIIGGAGSVEAPAALLAGWLVASLDLTLNSTESEGHRISATLYDGTRGVHLILQPAASSAQIEQLVFRTEEALLSVSLQDVGRLVLRSDWGDAPTERVVSMEADDIAALALRAVDDESDEGLYGEAARAALTLLS
jgi:glucose-6-phosphate dehydrogenase assembly protein OpcA